MPAKSPSRNALRVSSLSPTGRNDFSLQPEPATLAALAEELALASLRKLRFEGRLRPQGKGDWRLEGRLGATVVQPCVVSLEPVTTRIEAEVLRTYVAVYDVPEEAEVEMPEDETVEPLGQWIDPEAVMIEALHLEIPDYPRTGDAELGEMVLTEPGVKPMTDEDAKPFAGLAELRDSLTKRDQ